MVPPMALVKISRRTVTTYLITGVEMERHIFIVLTNEVPGRDDEYNTWHTDHIKDILDVPEVVSGQRFKLSAPFGSRLKYGYLAMYDLYTDNPGKVLEEIQARADNGVITVSDAMSNDLWAACFRPITETIKSGE